MRLDESKLPLGWLPGDPIPDEARLPNEPASKHEPLKAETTQGTVVASNPPIALSYAAERAIGALRPSPEQALFQVEDLADSSGKYTTHIFVPRAEGDAVSRYIRPVVTTTTKTTPSPVRYSFGGYEVNQEDYERLYAQAVEADKLQEVDELCGWYHAAPNVEVAITDEVNEAAFAAHVRMLLERGGFVDAQRAILRHLRMTDSAPGTGGATRQCTVQLVYHLGADGELVKEISVQQEPRPSPDFSLLTEL